MAETIPAYVDDDVQNGSDVLVYINTGTQEVPVMQKIACCTSSQITDSAESKDRVTKDTGRWKKKRVTGFTVQIKCDALVSLAENSNGYDLLKAKMRAGEPVFLQYGHKSVSNKIDQGYFIISSLDKTDAAQEDSTFSATFDNSGEVITVDVAS